MKHIDIKVTIWQRLHVDDKADLAPIIDRLEKGYLPAELFDHPELGVEHCETMYDTEEFITPVENDGQSTIEVMQDGDVVWDNSFESEIKRKQKQ